MKQGLAWVITAQWQLSVLLVIAFGWWLMGRRWAGDWIHDRGKEE